MRFSIVGIVTALLCGCAPIASKEPAAYGTWGVETEAISETISPGDDFFRYVNEGWLAQAEIQPGRSGAGVYPDLYVESEERVTEIMQSLGKGGWEEGSIERQLHDFYLSHI